MELDPKAKEGNRFKAKFVRVKDKIYTTEPDDLDTPHDDLVQQHGVSKQIAELKNNHPADVDAGLVMFFPPNILKFLLYSLKLGLPIKSVEDQARQGTVQIAQRNFPTLIVERESLNK